MPAERAADPMKPACLRKSRRAVDLIVYSFELHEWFELDGRKS
jgi:hypothetical protein